MTGGGGRIARVGKPAYTVAVTGALCPQRRRGVFPMRRKDREVTDFSRMLEIVQRCDCCRIGLVEDGEAYIVPLNFGYDVEGDTLTLYFHSAAAGRKLDLLPAQKQVAFEMDTGHKLVAGPEACDYTCLYECVMGKGELTLLTEDADRRHALERVMAHYTGREGWEYIPQYFGHMAMLRLTVREWSCKVHD